jgi:hypothetical protein
MKQIALAASAFAMVAVPAYAQTASRMITSSEAMPDASYETIRGGMLGKAETKLMRAHMRQPHSPEIMLNLAAVQIMTGRPVLAGSLYRSVLNQPPVAINMPSGQVVSSHEVARRGLKVIEKG